MLPKTAEYALRVAVWLGRAPGQHKSAEELAKTVQVPRRYVHRVLRDLVEAGLVRSQLGPGGGYALDRSPQEISILDVVTAVGPIERIATCPLGLKSHTSLCPLHSELDNAYAAMEGAFARVTIAQLLSASSKIPALCEMVGEH